jgi:Arc/MetJ-type ribon-helix-helix transcriptional regulator
MRCRLSICPWTEQGGKSNLEFMSATKVAISIDERLLHRLDMLVKARLFRSRSQVVQEAVSEKIGRMDKSALARECAKLDRQSEQAIADEGLLTDASEWPKSGLNQIVTK